MLLRGAPGCHRSLTHWDPNKMVEKCRRYFNVIFLNWIFLIWKQVSLLIYSYEFNARYVNLRVAHAPGMPGTFSPPLWVSDPDTHHGTCVTHVSWCMPGSLTRGFSRNRWRGKRFRHSRRMRNPQFYVSGKRPIGNTFVLARPWLGVTKAPFVNFSVIKNDLTKV